jgi:hypothetical protein
VQKSDFQEKSQKILQKSYFTRRHMEPEYETKMGQEGTTPPGGVMRHGVDDVSHRPVRNPKRKV